ncbi:MAG TPA: hypothetical protein VHM88_04435 [Candidatus Acidoferrales bacterium]|nr:hypothetical protein [Candidatus Acidoferrales bacterium]
MADWRQIQARIRKAKASDDAPARLSELYEKTRDAMVAFELARIHEQSGQNEEAARWYTAAAERFRRAQWREKAAEALARLGAHVPLAGVEPAALPGLAEHEVAAAPAAEFAVESREPAAEQSVLPSEPATEHAAGAEAAPLRQRRRRGRRGGRGRRRGQRAEGPPPRAVEAHTAAREPSARLPEEHAARAAPPPGLEREGVHEGAAGPAAWQARGRAGEPALASRLAHLESQLRRLVASPLYRLEQAEQAPAGPGVFILSDSDLTTYYHIEACQTVRVGVGNLLRGERGAHRGESLRARFAEHLGINESRVSKYLKEHCAVRWLQLDEDAPLLAHFAIAVLRPTLDE